MLPVPAQAQALFDQGVQHQAAGRFSDAEICFRQTLAAWPEGAPAWVNLGLVLEAQGALADAADCHRQATTLDPSLYEAALNLGTVLTRLQRFEHAEAAFRQAIALRPQAPATWSNLGAMLACQRRDADAEACCRHALGLDPDHDKARFNLGYLLLRQGRLAEGWLCQEAREGPAWLQSKLPFPRWDGAALQGRSLLLVSDAGHGDLIQMARYGQVLKQGGAGRIVLQAQPALKSLLVRDAGFDEVRGFDEPFPSEGIDLWSPVMSLPHLLGTQLHDIPATLPYLRADPVQLAQQRQIVRNLGSAAQLKVGLVWRGNAQHESDADRSLHDLALLRPLGGLPHVQFINLQFGATAEELESLRQSLHLASLPHTLGDFNETAAVIANLDLLVAVDTSTVHLAGALGIPAWVLLHEHKTDCRWLDARADSPWYPGVVRLFRQPRAGDWASVMAELALALRELHVPRAPGAPKDSG